MLGPMLMRLSQAISTIALGTLLSSYGLTKPPNSCGQSPGYFAEDVFALGIGVHVVAICCLALGLRLRGGQLNSTATWHVAVATLAGAALQPWAIAPPHGLPAFLISFVLSAIAMLDFPSWEGLESELGGRLADGATP